MIRFHNNVGDITPKLGSSTTLEKLKLLLWKNILLQQRHKWQTIFEILSPVIFATFLIFVRFIVDPKFKGSMDYPAFKPTYINFTGPLIANMTSGSKGGTIAYSPSSSLTRSMIENTMLNIASENMNSLLSIGFRSSQILPFKDFKNAKEMETALTKHNAMDSVFVGIQFDDKMANATEWPDNITITLRFPAIMRMPMLVHPLKACWRTNLLFPLFPRPGPMAPDDKYGGTMPGYKYELFLTIQNALSREIIKKKSGKTVKTKVFLKRMPRLPFKEDDLTIALERFVSMILMLCFAYTFVNTVRAVTQEKELQLKETMKIMGIPSWLHWLAWFIKQLTYSFISVVLLVILLKIPLKRMSNGEGFAVLTYTPFSMLMFFLILFVIASLAFCFMVSSFFNTANTAASFMGLAWFATYSIYLLSQGLYEQTALTTKLLISLISNTAIGFAFQLIVAAESFEGLQWNKFFNRISYHDELKPVHIAIMLVIDTILYMLIAMYVEKIRPGSYGVPLPWYFPFTKNFWTPRIRKTRALSRNKEDVENEDSLLRVVHDEEPAGVPLGVDIRNLKKVYGKKKKAVDDLSFRMYENEITVLLGHNGAGKTTTISMMTGMVPPTSGTAYINGRDIVTETEEARKSIGLCPQHNVLFPDLTVTEHIIFYGRIKGVSNKNISEEVDRYLTLLELEEKRNVLSQHLSGGQQRRLSVCIAMCGSSRVVLLDEPTSGLDPSARRALWDLLQKEKKGRTIILTTHFMDEADVLADRIAIMAAGRLQCIGTPYFLKKHYGVGYKLTIVKGENCNVALCTEFIKSYVSDVTVNTDIGSELTYILATAHVNAFPDLLKNLEEQKDSLKIDSYGLSVTTLEEVFMSTGAENFARNDNPPSSKQTSSTTSLRNSQINSIKKVKGFKLLINHITAMFLKLAYSATRNKLQNLIQFLSPIINISLSVLISRSWKFITSLSPLTLNLKPFKQTRTLMSHIPGLSDTENAIMAAYKDYFINSGNANMLLEDLGNKSLSEHYKYLHRTNLAETRFETIVGATFAPGNITGWFSNYGYHDSAISLALVNNAILHALSPNASLNVVNYPLPFSISDQIKVMSAGSSIGFQFAFNIAFCMAFVISFITLFVVKERISGAKLLQRVSGVQPIVMWGCALVWDWLWLLLINLCIIVTLAAYQEYTLSTFEELGRVFLVLIVFSFAIIPIHYLASYYFQAAATGFAKMCFLNMFTGCMPFLIAEVLRIPEMGNPYWAKILDWVFAPLPLYCLSRSFRDMSITSFTLISCNALCEQYSNVPNCTALTMCQNLNISVCCLEENPYLKWEEPGIARYLFIMATVGVIGFTIMLMKEYELFSKVSYLIVSRQSMPIIFRDDIEIEDSDVASERAYVRSLSRKELSTHSLVVSNLTKTFDTLLAVDRLCFAVRRGECFGLLGVNGAGKTTTFKMLTGDARVSYGDALVLGYSIKTEPEEVHRRIGYCPQFDGLLDNLTGRETLRIYCLLRGIPAQVGKQSAIQLARSLGFLKHFDKMVHEYSGGTKRKLSTALALLGDAPLVYLDEPTTGMDPASKRLVWSCVSEAAVQGRSVVLTSHSMEECEALCTRLTIMVNGRLNCLGTLQHLKNKFSQALLAVLNSYSSIDVRMSYCVGYDFHLEGYLRFHAKIGKYKSYSFIEEWLKWEQEYSMVTKMDSRVVASYTVVVKCKPGAERDVTVNAVNLYIKANFNDSRLIDTYLGICTYYVNDADVAWWQMFDVMEKAKNKFAIDDYSVTQTTLEQVFLQFTKHQGQREPIPKQSFTQDVLTKIKKQLHID